MYLGRVIGRVVATKKDPHLAGRKLLLVRPMLADPDQPGRLKAGTNTIVALDTLGAGEGELVMLVQGSSARQAEGLKEVPVDAAVVGLVDHVEILGETAFRASAET
jgi:ethanolamine utilization protein EutN